MDDSFPCNMTDFGATTRAKTTPSLPFPGRPDPKENRIDPAPVCAYYLDGHPDPPPFCILVGSHDDDDAAAAVGRTPRHQKETPERPSFFFFMLVENKRAVCPSVCPSGNVCVCADAMEGT